MKYITIIFALYLYNGLHAQQPVPTFFASEKKLVDERGKVIGKMAMIPGLRSEVFLKSCVRSKDSSGNYVIEYAFVGQNNLEAHDVTLILQFEKPFNDVLFNTEGQVDNVYTTIADNKLGTSYHTSRLAPDAVIKISVIGNKQDPVVITGIAGQLEKK